MASAVQWVGSTVTRLVGQGATELRAALDHIRSTNCPFHGPQCSWCRALRRDQQPHLAIHASQPLLHPEPMFLYCSGRSSDYRRHWLLIDLLGNPSAHAYVKQWQHGYTAKYGVNHDVELSEHGTEFCAANLERAARWLTRPEQCSSFVTILSASPAQSAPVEAQLWPLIASCAQTDRFQWVILDHFGEPHTAPIGLAYTYTISASGCPCVTRRPSPKQQFTTDGGTVLVLYTQGSAAPPGASVSVRMAWQQALHQVIVNLQGHRSLGDLLTLTNQLLRILGVTVTLESNRLLNMDETFFGFNGEPAAVPSRELLCSAPPPTSGPRTTGESDTQSEPGAQP